MIVLTGASGFVGAHLLKALTKKYGPDGVVALTSAPPAGARYLLNDGYQFGPGFFEGQGISAIDTLIHAGAFTPKSGAEADNWEACNSNVINTDRLLKALPPTKRLIFLSTLDVYGADSIISEASPISPTTLYGQSKVYCERMVESWGKAAGAIVQNLRIGHVYGPGEDKYRKIIPEAFRAILAGQSPKIWGTGAAIRSFIYIEDIVDLILGSLELEQYEGPINLVGGHQVTIKDLVGQIIAVTGASVDIEYIPMAVENTRDLLFDTGKMERLLGPERTTLAEGLRKEWDYFRVSLG